MCILGRPGRLGANNFVRTKKLRDILTAFHRERWEGVRLYFNIKIILMEMLEMTIKAHHCFRIIIRRLGPGLAQLVRLTFLSVRII